MHGDKVSCASIPVKPVGASELKFYDLIRIEDSRRTPTLSLWMTVLDPVHLSRESVLPSMGASTPYSIPIARYLDDIKTIYQNGKLHGYA